MAEVILKNIKKIYPHQGKGKHMQAGGAYGTLVASKSPIAVLARVFTSGRRACRIKRRRFEIARNLLQRRAVVDASTIHVYHWRATEFRQAAQHHAQPFGVVPVFMGDEYGLESRGVEARFVAAFEEIALANSTVNKHARASFGVFDNGGIAFAAACEHM